MAQFYTSFQHHPVGTQPAGWTETWGSGNSDFTVNDLGSDQKVARNSISATADHLLAWTDVGSVANVEVVAKMRTNQNGNYENTIFIRSSASDASKTGYYLAMNYTNGGVKLMNLEQWLNNTYYPWHGHNYNWQPNTWYWMRYRAIGSEHWVKWWQDGSAEPGWLYYYNDTSGTAYNGAGYVAIAGYTAGGARDWDIVGVGTNGDTAPTSPLLTTLTVNNASIGVSTNAINLIPQATPIISEGFMYGGWGGAIRGASLYGAGSLELVENIDLVVHDASIGLSAQQATLAQQHALSVASASIGVSSTTPALIENKTLSISDAYHGLSATIPDLVEHQTLSIDNALIGLYSDSPTPTSEGYVAPQGSIIAVTADHVQLTQAHTLQVHDANIGVSSESPDPVMNTVLQINNAAIGVSAQSQPLIQNHTLTIHDAEIALSAGEPEIDQQQFLAIHNASIGVVSDEIFMQVVATLIISDAMIGVTAEEGSVGIYQRDTPTAPRIKQDRPVTKPRMAAPSIKDSQNIKGITVDAVADTTLVDDLTALVDDPDVVEGTLIDYSKTPKNLKNPRDTISTKHRRQKRQGVKIWNPNSPQLSQPSTTSTPTPRSQRTIMRPDTTKSTPRLQPSQKKSARTGRQIPPRMRID